MMPGMIEIRTMATITSVRFCFTTGTLPKV